MEHGIDEHGIDNGPRSESDVRAERIRRLEDVEDESVEEQNQNELLLEMIAEIVRYANAKHKTFATAVGAIFVTTPH